MRWNARWRGIVLAALVLATAARTSAQQDRAEGEGEVERSDGEARVHFRLGRAYYESGRFAEAAEEFEEAYEHSGRAQLLYNVFLARRDAGQLDQAIEALKKYLEGVPEAKRDALEARLESIKRLRGQRERSAGEGETTSEPGSGEVADQGEAADEEAGTEGAGAGEATTEEGGSKGEGGPAGDPVVQDDGGGGRSSIPWIVMSVGGALLAGGTITGVLALKEEKDLEGQCGPDGTSCPPGFESQTDRGQTLATTTDVLLAVGGVAVGAGVVLLFLLDDDTTERAPTTPDSPTASVGCSANGCLGQLRLSF